MRGGYYSHTQIAICTLYFLKYWLKDKNIPEAVLRHTPSPSLFPHPTCFFSFSVSLFYSHTHAHSLLFLLPVSSHFSFPSLFAPPTLLLCVSFSSRFSFCSSLKEVVNGNVILLCINAQWNHISIVYIKTHNRSVFSFCILTRCMKLYKIIVCLSNHHYYDYCVK